LSESSVNSSEERPFWLRPPWMILFDLIRLKRVRPWDVRIAHLLGTLLQEMRNRGFVDFVASGVALLSSSMIFRMKTERILELQEPPPPPPTTRVEQLPPPIQMPYRFEYTFTTLDDLLDALEEALRGERPVEVVGGIQVPPAPPDFRDIDDFMLNIDKHMNEMFNQIMELLKDLHEVPFSRLVEGLTRFEAIRAFILILFLACRGRIFIRQDEEFGEIFLTAVNTEDAWLADYGDGGEEDGEQEGDERREPA